MDVSVRKLRYFVVVADEMHFTRAAHRLFITQQSLSKQIQEFEAQLGFSLFLRSRRSVELTAAGQILLARVRPLLIDLADAVASAQRAGRADVASLRVGFGTFAALELTSLILEEFGRLHPDVEVDMREYALPDQTAGLADGWADASFVRPPLAAPGLVIQPLFVEPRVLSVARSHPLGGRSAVDVSEVLNLTLSIGMSDDEEYRRFWSLDSFRNSGTAPALRRTSTNTEELQLVASGMACTVNPAAVARYLPYQEVACIPITGIPGSVLALAWRKGHRNPLITDLASAARTVRDREADIVWAIEHPFPADGAAAPSHNRLTTTTMTTPAAAQVRAWVPSR